MAAFMQASPVSGLMGASDQWSTRLGQCEGTPVEQWLLSIFCLPCAMAKAKSNTDQTHPCFNFLCWTPIGSHNFVRLGYGIKGECGEDCAKVIFCSCCSTRQTYHETESRGQLKGAYYGQNTREWMTGSLFGCTVTELCMTLCCPCIVTHRVRNILQPSSDQWFDCCCVLPTAMYGDVRNTYGLKSECPDAPCLEDMGVGLFCFPCALARAQREALAQKAAGVAGGVMQGVAGVVGGMVGTAKKYARV